MAHARRRVILSWCMPLLCCYLSVICTRGIRTKDGAVCLQVSISSWDENRDEAFYKLMKKKLLEPPWNRTVEDVSEWQVRMRTWVRSCLM